MKTILFFFLILQSVLLIHGNQKRRLKILVNSPSYGWSHMQYQGKLADVLVEAGHEVHVLIFESNPLYSNYNGTFKAHRIIRVPRIPELKYDIMNIKFITDHFSGFSNMLLDGSWVDFIDFSTRICRELIHDHQDLLEDLKREQYDVGISEMYDACIFGIFHRIGAKSIVGSYAVATSIINHLMGIPSFSSYCIGFWSMTVNGPYMDFYERAYNFFMDVYDKYTYREKTYADQQSIFNEYYGPEFPSLKEIIKNVSMVFMNSNEFFDLPRPTSHKIVHIGGIADVIGDKPLDKDVQSIFTNSKKGVVLFSFGTLADTKQIKHNVVKSFLKAFSHFPDFDFIWKYEQNENYSISFSSAPNVHTFDWVNQKAILAQPQLKAFITHCGLNSMTEAANAGVPTIGIPLFGDQLLNAAIMKHKRMGVYVDITKAGDSGLLIEALNKVLHDDSYRENAQLIGRKLKSHPFKPAERLVKWVEFAAEFSDLNELNLPSEEELGLFVYYSLDVIGLALFILSSALFLFVKVSALIIRRIVSMARLFNKLKEN